MSLCSFRPSIGRKSKDIAQTLGSVNKSVHEKLYLMKENHEKALDDVYQSVKKEEDERYKQECPFVP